MGSGLPRPALKSIVTNSFINQQSDENARRYVPYSFTQGLRKAMGHLSADKIQELSANRSFTTDRDDIAALTGTTVSSILSGEAIVRDMFELEFDRASHGTFSWPDVRSLLGQPSTIYDLPVRRIVVRISDEELHEKWINEIETAIEIDDFPTSWIEPPFFAVLKSSEPGDSDAKDNVKSVHEDFYHMPNFSVSEDFKGMDWSIRTLDLQSVWSYHGFVDTSRTILTTRTKDRQYNWTPRRIERYLMNFFDVEEDYTGVIRNSDFASMWRRIYSTDITSTKEFAWKGDEEWTQTG